MTIYDIAKEAGVSASTVSRVINKKKGVRKENRIIVEELLKKYRFQPDASARGLVQQSTKIIGIMMSDIRTSHHAEGTYFIEQELKKYNYNCIIINSGFSSEAHRESIRTLASRRVDAVVLVGSSFQTDDIRKAIIKYLGTLPVIIENGYIDLPNVYGVLADEENGISDCVHLLYKKGKKNPIFVNRSKTPSNCKKILGFETACKKYAPDREPPVFHMDTEGDAWQTSFDITLKIMKEHPETDALIYATDLLANAGIMALHQLGISIPEEVAVIGVDNSIYSRICSPRLTSLNNKMDELSITCASLLVSLLNGEKAAHKMMIFSSVVEREST